MGLRQFDDFDELVGVGIAVLEVDRLSSADQVVRDCKFDRARDLADTAAPAVSKLRGGDRAILCQYQL